MNNLQSMLSKPAAQANKPTAHNINVSVSSMSEELISAKLSLELVEYIRDFQYAEAFRTGNLRFTFKDAISAMIAEHKASHPEVSARPNAAKAGEKKTGRRHKN